MTTTYRALGLGALFALGGTAALATECIAPANPGGGWDFTCRQIGKILYDIGEVDQPGQSSPTSPAPAAASPTPPS